VVTVYTPNAKDDLSRVALRFKHWDPAFLAYCQQLEKTKPVIFCGDLNVAHTELDLANQRAIGARRASPTRSAAASRTSSMPASSTPSASSSRAMVLHVVEPLCEFPRPQHRMEDRLLPDLAGAASSSSVSRDPSRCDGQRSLPRERHAARVMRKRGGRPSAPTAWR